jgi:hypothetical protein
MARWMLVVHAARNVVAGCGRRSRPPHPSRQGYRCHNHTWKSRVWITSRVHWYHPPIRREMCRCAAAERILTAAGYAPASLRCLKA